MLWLSVALAAAPPPIVNGEDAPNYDGVVMLRITNEDDGYGGTCSGTLVAETWVLTAAHCVVSAGWYSVAHVYVSFAQEAENASNSNTIEAVSWTPRPGYDPYTSENDLAMVELPQGMGAHELALASEAPTPEDKGVEFRIVGFGATDDQDWNEDPTRRQADVPLYDYDDQLLYTFDAEDDQNACYGDSGGALLRPYADGSFGLAGVIDYVSGCRGGGLGASRVDRAIDWIGTFTAGYTVHEGETVSEEPPPPDDTGTDNVEVPTLCATAHAPSAWGIAAGALLFSRRRRQGV